MFFHNLKVDKKSKGFPGYSATIQNLLHDEDSWINDIYKNTDEKHIADSTETTIV